MTSPAQKEQVDVVIDHEGESTLVDAKSAAKMLKTNGVLASARQNMRFYKIAYDSGLGKRGYRIVDVVRKK